jgi:flagellar hook-associated protein FlgK
MISALQSALQGMSNNQSKMLGHAQNISRMGATESKPGMSPNSLPEEMTGMLVAQRGFEANIAVFRASDEMLGSLIDVLA